jgi:hypothetical protein
MESKNGLDETDHTCQVTVRPKKTVQLSTIVAFHFSEFFGNLTEYAVF